MIGDVLWSPPADLADTTEIGRFMSWLATERGRELGSYEELWRWSVSDLEGFWGSIVDFFAIRFSAPYERVLADRTMPGAPWFEGGRLNYAKHLIGAEDDR